jgi:filamentous hemagglutinin
MFYRIIVKLCKFFQDVTEAKASQTAPLTKNQKAAHPSIEKSGGTVVGKGKPGYEGGTKIPRTKVNVVRKTDN